MLRLKYAARSDVGMIRSGNEDSFETNVNADRGVFVVADGMGGHAAGEVASLMAVQAVITELGDLQTIDDAGKAATKLADLRRPPNRNIHARMSAKSERQGMATTASFLVLDQKRYLIGQVAIH